MLSDSEVRCPGFFLNFFPVLVTDFPWATEPGGMGGCSPPVFATFLQNLPFLPQILAFLCLQPPHVPVSPRTLKFTPPSLFSVFLDFSE